MKKIIFVAVLLATTTACGPPAKRPWEVEQEEKRIATEKAKQSFCAALTTIAARHEANPEWMKLLLGNEDGRQTFTAEIQRSLTSLEGAPVLLVGEIVDLCQNNKSYRILFSPVLTTHRILLDCTPGVAEVIIKENRTGPQVLGLPCYALIASLDRVRTSYRRPQKTSESEGDETEIEENSLDLQFCLTGQCLHAERLREYEEIVVDYFLDLLLDTAKGEAPNK